MSLELGGVPHLVPFFGCLVTNALFLLHDGGGPGGGNVFGFHVESLTLPASDSQASRASWAVNSLDKRNQERGNIATTPVTQAEVLTPRIRKHVGGERQHKNTGG